MNNGKGWRKIDAGSVVRVTGVELALTQPYQKGREKREMATRTPQGLSVSRSSYADSRIILVSKRPIKLLMQVSSPAPLPFK